jgi:hypothetical protein
MTGKLKKRQNSKRWDGETYNPKTEGWDYDEDEDSDEEDEEDSDEDEEDYN